MGDGGSVQDIVKRQFVQRSLATANPAASSFDPLSPDSISAQQRAASRMREGLNSNFGTSTRGIDSAPGSGLQGPPDPIIPPGAVTDQTGTNAVDDAVSNAKQAALSAPNYQKNKQERPAAPAAASTRVYRF